MSVKVKDMTSGKPMKLIFLFALPLMVGNIFQQLYMVVDAIVVGQGVGVDALAAVGATDWTHWVLLWMILGLTQGFAVMISQFFGAGDIENLRKTVTMSIVLCLGFGVFFTVLGLIIARPTLQLLRTPDDIIDQALIYLSILFGGMLIVTVYNIFSSILRALGDGRTPLIAMILAGCINIVLDLLFVLVFHWGIAGAAIATLLAQAFSAVYCILSVRRISVLSFEKKYWKLDWDIIKHLCSLGIPIGLQMAIIGVGGMVLQFVLNQFGTTVIAGFTATNKLYGLLESSAISFGFAMNTFVGQNLGARKFDRIHEGVRSVIKLSILLCLAIGGIMILFGKPLLSMFVSSSAQNKEQVLDIAYQYLFIMSCTLIFLYLLHAYRAALQGLGNGKKPMISGLMETLMRVGVSLILPRIIGEIGIFFCEPAAWFGAAVYLIFAYYSEIRKIVRKLETEQADSALQNEQLEEAK